MRRGNCAGHDSSAGGTRVRPGAGRRPENTVTASAWWRYLLDWILPVRDHIAPERGSSTTRGRNRSRGITSQFAALLENGGPLAIFFRRDLRAETFRRRSNRLHVRFMSSDGFGNCAGKAFQLLVGRKKLKVRCRRSDRRGCRSIPLCGSVDRRRRHIRSIGQTQENVNHARIARRPLTAPMESDPETAVAAGNSDTGTV